MECESLLDFVSDVESRLQERYDAEICRDFELCFLPNSATRQVTHSECEAVWEEWEIYDPEGTPSWNRDKYREIPHYTENENLGDLISLAIRHFPDDELSFAYNPQQAVWTATIGNTYESNQNLSDAIMKSMLTLRFERLFQASENAHKQQSSFSP